MNRNVMEKIFARYGQAVTIEHADGASVETAAMMQPVTERKETVPEGMTGIGWRDGRLWKYFGSTQVQSGDVVIWNGKRFRVRSARGWHLGETLHHWWAVLEQAKEAAE